MCFGFEYLKNFKEKYLNLWNHQVYDSNPSITTYQFHLFRITRNLNKVEVFPVLIKLFSKNAMGQSYGQKIVPIDTKLYR